MNDKIPPELDRLFCKAASAFVETTKVADYNAPSLAYIAYLEGRIAEWRRTAEPDTEGEPTLLLALVKQKETIADLQSKLEFATRDAESWKKGFFDLRKEVDEWRPELIGRRQEAADYRRGLENVVQFLKDDGLTQIAGIIQQVLDKYPAEVTPSASPAILSFVLWASKNNLRRKMGMWALDGHAFVYTNEGIVKVFLTNYVPAPNEIPTWHPLHNFNDKNGKS